MPIFFRRGPATRASNYRNLSQGEPTTSAEKNDLNPPTVTRTGKGVIPTTVESVTGVVSIVTSSATAAEPSKLIPIPIPLDINIDIERIVEIGTFFKVVIETGGGG